MYSRDVYRHPREVFWLASPAPDMPVPSATLLKHVSESFLDLSTLTKRMQRAFCNHFLKLLKAFVYVWRRLCN